MRALYTFGVLCYGLGIRLASLFNPKAKKWIRGRKGIFDTLPNVKNKEVVWFHCASFGEFDQGLPLMNLIKTENPDTFLIITFFSPSGFEHYEKRDHLADFACYLPLDTPSNARKFVSIIQPKSTYFVKYEFWANYIVEAKKAGSSIYNVSGLFRNSHRFFKWYGGFFRSVLGKFDFFFVQNETSKDLLERISIKNVEVTGDSRFDRVIENSKKADSNKIIEEFQADQTNCIVVNAATGGTGVSLHDTHGNRPRLSLISPSFNAKEFAQVLGRIHRNGAKTDALQRVMLSHGSIEEYVMNAIATKLKAMDNIHKSNICQLTSSVYKS